MDNQTKILKTSLLQISRCIFFSTLILLPSTVCGMFEKSERSERFDKNREKVDFTFYVDAFEDSSKLKEGGNIYNPGEICSLSSKSSPKKDVIISYHQKNKENTFYELTNTTAYSSEEAKTIFKKYKNISISTSLPISILTEIIDPKKITKLTLRNVSNSNIDYYEGLKKFKNHKSLEIQGNNHDSNNLYISKNVLETIAEKLNPPINNLYFVCLSTINRKDVAKIFFEKQIDLLNSKIEKHVKKFKQLVINFHYTNHPEDNEDNPGSM